MDAEERKVLYNVNKNIEEMNKNIKELLNVFIIWFPDVTICIVYIPIFILFILTKNIILKGKIIDADTELGIPFVSLGIIGKNTGTATNENGEFKFNISEELSKSELLISHIGYKKFTKPVEYFIDNIIMENEDIALRLSDNEHQVLITLSIQKKK